VAEHRRGDNTSSNDPHPDRLGGVKGATADAVASKFLVGPLTDAQIRDPLQIPFK